MSEFIIKQVREQMISCSLCGDLIMRQDGDRHHVVPKSKGGQGKEIKYLCRTCHNQIHSLFNEKELSLMSFEELLDHGELKKYLKWKEKHPGIFGVRMSNNVREWKRYHR